MPQFLVSSKSIIDSKIVISDKDNYTHIVKSLRSKIGEKLNLIDENQIRYDAVIEDISNKDIIAKINNSYKSERKLDFQLYLAQVPLRSDAQAVIIEKATELGVNGVFPVISDNCALNKKIIEKKLPKWQRIMYEAFKQCERADIPECFNAVNIETILNMKNDYKIIAFCERHSDSSLHKYFMTNPLKKDDKLLVIIGPEGGFSDREFDLFKQNKIPMLTLGNLILKAETATIVALGNVIYEFENYRKN